MHSNSVGQTDRQTPNWKEKELDESSKGGWLKKEEGRKTGQEKGMIMNTQKDTIQEDREKKEETRLQARREASVGQ